MDLDNAGHRLTFGLLFGLGSDYFRPNLGFCRMGVPWDWGDVRLNSYALLTSVALLLVMSIRSQPDGEETRDTLAAIGLFGFVLVPRHSCCDHSMEESTLV